MAEIAPFRGLRYNLRKIHDLSQVVIPPYDVISPEEQERFYEMSPYNMVRLELGKPTDHDSVQNNPHSRAARSLDQWMAEGVLTRDEAPSIYYYELDYDLPDGERRTRCGFICALRLEDFSSGSVRPHEKTFQAVKDERLALMLACHANLSPVFALYADSDEDVDRALKGGKSGPPALAFKDDKGMDHRIWPVTDSQLLHRVRECMRDKTLFIADGHHRYETALNYRNIQRQMHPTAGANASFEFIMVYLSNMNQQGLTILPTHRLLKNLNGRDMDAVLNKAEEFFEVFPYPLNDASQSDWLKRLAQGGRQGETVIGLLCRAARSFYILQSRRGATDAYLADLGISRELRALDVVILDQVILKNLMGLSDAFLANEHNIHFKHDFHDALGRVKSGQYDLGFFINPTRIEQVQEVAGAGLIMPHKSTYFYPKVGSGLVIRLLSADEETIF